MTPIIDAECPCCGGRGSISVDWGLQPCPRCRLEADRIRAAHEASTEAAYKEQYGPDYDRLATYQAEGR